MAEPIETLATEVQTRFAGMAERCVVAFGELTLQIPRAALTDVCLALRDEPGFRFDMLIDLCGVDYQTYGEGSWTGPRFAKNLFCRTRLRVWEPTTTFSPRSGRRTSSCTTRTSRSSR